MESDLSQMIHRKVITRIGRDQELAVQNSDITTGTLNLVRTLSSGADGIPFRAVAQLLVEGE